MAARSPGRLVHGQRERVLLDAGDVVALEACENGRQIAGPLDHGSRGLAQLHPHFCGNNVRERGFAQARRTKEQQVIERLAAAPRGGNEDLQLLTDFFLTDIVGERARPQGPLHHVFAGGTACGGDDAVVFDHGARRVKRGTQLLPSWRSA